MIPMTTQELGQQPGGARLGAFASRCRSHAAASAVRADRGGWRVAVAAPPHVATGVANPAANADTGYVGTTGATGLGFGLIKRTPRPLGARST